MNFKDNLKRIRKEHNLSQEELAEKLNVTRQAVSKWESGLAYPEMDKVITICKLFNLNIDDLLNNDLKQIKEKQNKTSTLNKYIESFLSYISKTVNLISSMTFTSKMKCLLEQVIITIILVIIFLIGDSILSHITYKFVYTYGLYTLFDILESLYYIISLIIYIFLITYIFKIRYLDYYPDFKEPPKEELTTNPPKVTLRDKEEKIIIRDPRHSEYRFINGLVKSIIFFIKIISLGIFAFLSLVLLFIIVLLTCSFLIVHNTLMFTGIFTTLIGFTLLDIILLIIIYHFITNTKRNDKFTIISSISSIIISGIGIGLFTMSLSNLNIVEDYTNQNFVTDTFTYPMNNDYIFRDYYYRDNFNYIEKDIPNIEVEVIHSKFYESKILNNDPVDNYHFIHLTYKNDDHNLYKAIIKDINNNKYIDYSNFKVNIYASKENISILKNNLERN